MHSNYPLHELYDLRTKFVLVGLTGITGSGCTVFSNLLYNSFDSWDSAELRDYKSLEKMAKSEHKSDVVFAREVAMCRDVCHCHSEDFRFKIIRYRNVLLFKCLMLLKKKHNSYTEFMDSFVSVIDDKFCKDNFSKNPYPIEWKEIKEVVKGCGINEDLFNALPDESKEQTDG